MRQARTRQRRAIAAIAAILWLLGVEVLPNLHLAAHDHDHTHAADGSIVVFDRDSGHRHAHAGGDHHHGAGGHDHHRAAADDELAALNIAHEHVVIDDGIWLGAHRFAADDAPGVIERGDVAAIGHGDDELAGAHDHGDDALALAHEHGDELAIAHGGDARHADDRTSDPDHHRDRGASGQLAFDHDLPLGHAAAGIAHHAIALHQPPPPLLAPVSAPSAETWTYAAPNERRGSAARRRPTARGPPVA